MSFSIVFHDPAGFLRAAGSVRELAHGERAAVLYKKLFSHHRFCRIAGLDCAHGARNMHIQELLGELYLL